LRLGKDETVGIAALEAAVVTPTLPSSQKPSLESASRTFPIGRPGFFLSFHLSTPEALVTSGKKSSGSAFLFRHTENVRDGGASGG